MDVARADVSEGADSLLTYKGSPHGTTGLPELPVTTIKYNTANQPEQIEETFGSGAEAKTRPKKTSFDPAGRPEATEETSSIDAALPKLLEQENKVTKQGRGWRPKGLEGRFGNRPKYRDRYSDRRALTRDWGSGRGPRDQ